MPKIRAMPTPTTNPGKIPARIPKIKPAATLENFLMIASALVLVVKGTTKPIIA
jgi:hypothetical protein